MQKLSLILVFILLVAVLSAQQNPHGDRLTYACTDCHTTAGWTFSKETAKFSHNKTEFLLEGQHNQAKCRDCHKTLVFNGTKSNCVDCHTDMHNNTLGTNCFECHTPKSWIVENVTEIHQRSRFPLLGAHNIANCSDCHRSASKLEFQPLGVDCYDCHRADYQATSNPNHLQTGLSTNCVECHRVDAFAWAGTGINHDFFPLTKGHEINSCAACHKGNVGQPVSAECFTCHQSDYNATSSPAHKSLGFATTCADCHTTDPGWKPADFKEHDAFFFPVYSGSHKGEWNKCTDCHRQPGSYTSFSCIDCHEHNKSEMDKKHREENGYSYNSLTCFACHPMGKGEGSFNHNSTDFPLKGAHIQTSCTDCHTKGFAGTSMACGSCHAGNFNNAANPNHVKAGISTICETCHNENNWKPSLFDHTATTGFALSGGHSGKQCSACHVGTTSAASSECFSCHQANYSQSVNPNHSSLGFSKNCGDCHTTVPGWNPARLPNHNDYYALNGAHAVVASNCYLCHSGNYTSTPNTCYACHTADYNSTANPSHTASQFSTDCLTCHTENVWKPSTFNHDAQYFPIYSGKHREKWSSCTDCHTQPANYTVFSCLNCHEHNLSKMNDKHKEVNGYVYASAGCLSCHPRGSHD